MVGTAALPDNYRHAFLYDARRGMVDLGTLGGGLSGATAINDAGVVVGSAQTKDRVWHAFVHDGKQMVDLGAKIGYGNSFATGINSAGHVVGTVLTDNERRTFVWRDGKMTVHRGGNGLHLTNSINDNGQIAGATFSRHMIAATMPSNAVLEMTKTVGTKLGPLALISLLLAGAAIVWRRRYRGLVLPRTIA